MALRKPNWGSHQTSDDCNSNNSVDTRSEDMNQQPVPSLYVTNLPPHTDFPFLVSLFLPYGRLSLVNLLRQKPPNVMRVAIVQFERAEDATKCMHGLPQHPQFTNLKIDFTRRDKERNFQKGLENFNGNNCNSEADKVTNVSRGSIAVSFNPGFEGRRIFVSDDISSNYPMPISDREEFCYQQNANFGDGRSSRFSQNKQLRDNLNISDDVNGQDSCTVDRRKHQQRSGANFDSENSGQYHGDNLNANRNYRGSGGSQKNFRGSPNDQNCRNDMGGKPNDIRKKLQRAKSCERLSNRSNQSKMRLNDSGVPHSKNKNEVSTDRIGHDGDQNKRMGERFSLNEGRENQMKKMNRSFDRQDVEQLKLPLIGSLRCLVSHWDKSGNFWVQTDDKLAETLAYKSDNIEDTCENFSPSIGEICLVQFDLDSLCYRGRIITENEDNTFNVFFIDYGNSSLNVPKHKIKTLPSKLYTIPAQAIACKPSKATSAKYQSATEFGKAIGGSHWNVNVEHCDGNNKYIVNLDAISNTPDKNSQIKSKLEPKEEITLNDKTEPKQAISDLLLSLKKTKEKKEVMEQKCDDETSRGCVPIAHSTPSSSPIRSLVAIHKETMEFVKKSNKEATCQREMQNDDTKSIEVIENPDNNMKLNNSNLHFGDSIIRLLKVGELIEVYPMFKLPQLRFWGTINFENSMGTLLKGINHAYKTSKEILTGTPTIGSLVVSWCKEWDSWGRAVVLSTDTQGTKIFFIDFGVEETVTNVKPISDDHRSFPALAALCEIESDKLNAKDKESFQCIIQAEEMGNILLRVVEKIDDENVKAICLEYNETPCLISSAQTRMGKKLNKFEQQKKNECIQEKVEEPITTIECLPILPHDFNTQVLILEVLDFNQIIIQSEIYFSDVTALMNSEPSSSGNENFIPRLKELVLAKYSDDGNWYRAEVISIEDKQAEVFFIDFGNKECVSFIDIRPITPEGLKIPYCVVSLQKPPESLDPLKACINKEIIQMTVIDNNVKPVAVEFYINKVKMFS